jgi:hypothetical protein
VISAAENANKFQKIRFWKEKSVEDVVRLGPTAQATLLTVNRRNNIKTFISSNFKCSYY